MSKAKFEEFEIVGRREVPDEPGYNFRGQAAVCVKLVRSGFLSWGFGVDFSDAFHDAYEKAVALKVKNG